MEIYTSDNHHGTEIAKNDAVLFVRDYVDDVLVCGLKVTKN